MGSKPEVRLGLGARLYLWNPLQSRGLNVLFNGSKPSQSSCLQGSWKRSELALFAKPWIGSRPVAPWLIGIDKNAWLPEYLVSPWKRFWGTIVKNHPWLSNPDSSSIGCGTSSESLISLNFNFFIETGAIIMSISISERDNNACPVEGRFNVTKHRAWEMPWGSRNVRYLWFSVIDHLTQSLQTFCPLCLCLLCYSCFDSSFIFTNYLTPSIRMVPVCICCIPQKSHVL